MTPILGIMASQISGHLTPPTAFESIQTVNGTGSSATITFSSIPATFKHLQVRMLAKDTYNGGSAITSYTPLVINGDTSAVYARHEINADGATVAASSAATQSRIERMGGIVDSGTGATSTFGVAIIDILDYASTTKYKTVRGFGGGDVNGSGYIRLQSGLWQSTAAINELSFLAPLDFFTSTTTFALYGVN
jgi:hypothetical protein